MRLALIANPKSGTKKAEGLLAEILPRLEAHGGTVDVHVTRSPGHARDLGRDLDVQALDGLCIVGGDGTIHEVLNGLRQRADSPDVPLGFIPAGSGNSICMDLAIRSPLEAVERILSRQTRRVDLAKVVMSGETRYCLNIIGWGAAVDINATAESLRIIGPPRYRAAAIWHILWARPRQARLILDDRDAGSEFLMVLACITRFTGKAMQLAPRANLADGKIDVVMVRQATRLQMLKLFRAIFDGTHLELPFVEYRQVESFRLETPGPDRLNLDGELAGHSPVSVTVLPRTLKIFSQEVGIAVAE